MRSRDSYTREEWRTLQFAYVWAFTALAGPDTPLMLAPDIGEAPIFKGEPLARDVVMSLQAEMQDVMARFGEDSRTVAQGLADVADLLDRKATASQGQDFKLAVIGLAHQYVDTLKGMLAQPGIAKQTLEGRPLPQLLAERIAEGEAALPVVASSLRASL